MLGIYARTSWDFLGLPRRFQRAYTYITIFVHLCLIFHWKQAKSSQNQPKPNQIQPKSNQINPESNRNQAKAKTKPRLQSNPVQAKAESSQNPNSIKAKSSPSQASQAPVRDQYRARTGLVQNSHGWTDFVEDGHRVAAHCERRPGIGYRTSLYWGPCRGPRRGWRLGKSAMKA